VAEELEVIISNDEKYLVDSKQFAAYIFSVGEGRGSWILRNSGDYLPDSTGSRHREPESKLSTADNSVCKTQDEES
jgi:hypothetical protein